MQIPCQINQLLRYHGGSPGAGNSLYLQTSARPPSPHYTGKPGRTGLSAHRYALPFLPTNAGLGGCRGPAPGQRGNLHPSEIVILAPYLPDALRFSLSHRLEEAGIPWRSHRPSRSLRDEPASHCLLTLAELAHPGWGIHPTKFDVTYAFLSAIEGMDLVRAQLLAEIVYRQRDFTLSSFEQIRSEMQ